MEASGLKKTLVALPALALSLCLLYTAASPAQASHRPQETANQKPVPSQPVTSLKYVGSEPRKTCHEDIHKNYEASPHFVTMLDTKQGPEL